MVGEAHFDKALTEKKKHTHTTLLSNCPWGPGQKLSPTREPPGGGGWGGESQHQTRQGDGPGSSSLLQAWGGGRQVSAGLGGCLKAEAWEGMGLGVGAGGTGSPGGCNWEGGNHWGPLGVGPAGGEEVGLEAVASAPFPLQLWLVQQATASPGTRAGAG